MNANKIIIINNIQFANSTHWFQYIIWFNINKWTAREPCYWPKGKELKFTAISGRHNFLAVRQRFFFLNHFITFIYIMIEFNASNSRKRAHIRRVNIAIRNLAAWYMHWTIFFFQLLLLGASLEARFMVWLYIAYNFPRIYLLRICDSVVFFFGRHFFFG